MQAPQRGFNVAETVRWLGQVYAMLQSQSPRLQALLQLPGAQQVHCPAQGWVAVPAAVGGVSSIY